MIILIIMIIMIIMIMIIMIIMIITVIMMIMMIVMIMMIIAILRYHSHSSLLYSNAMYCHYETVLILPPRSNETPPRHHCFCCWMTILGEFPASFGDEPASDFFVLSLWFEINNQLHTCFVTVAAVACYLPPTNTLDLT